MKVKNIQSDYDSMSLEELTNEANLIIDYLENQENIDNEIETYQNLLKLNKLIEKKFQKNVKNINLRAKEKITQIFSKKYAK